MIHTVLKTGEQLSSVDGLPQPEHDAQVIWLEVNAPTLKKRRALRERFGIETRPQLGNVVEDGELLYLRSQLVELGANGDAALCKRHVRPWRSRRRHDQRRCPSSGRSVPFCSAASADRAMLRVRRRYCDCCCKRRTTVPPAVIDYVADALVQTTGEISEISDGYDAKRPRAGGQRPQRDDAAA